MGPSWRKLITCGGWVLRVIDERWVGRKGGQERKEQLDNRTGLMGKEKKTFRGEEASSLLPVTD